MQLLPFADPKADFSSALRVGRARPASHRGRAHSGVIAVHAGLAEIAGIGGKDDFAAARDAA